MIFDVITLFPQMFDALTQCGITRRAEEQGRYVLKTWNPRDFTTDNHRTVDDRPYGGGPGMVMLAEPLAAAIRAACERQQASGVSRSRVVYLSPQGRLLTHAIVKEIVAVPQEGLILLTGRYEGIDERVRQHLVTDEISIGDYILTGGELPAMVLVDSVVRLLPGVLGDSDSIKEETFEDNLLEYPIYTRPANFKGMKVPEVLLSGDHERIKAWRRSKAFELTKKKRPDLIKNNLK